MFGKTICVALLQLAMPNHDFLNTWRSCTKSDDGIGNSAQKTVQGTHALMSIVRPSSFQKNNAKNAMVENMWVGTTFGMRSPR